jgi:hypothetical protein
MLFSVLSGRLAARPDVSDMPVFVDPNLMVGRDFLPTVSLCFQPFWDGNA